MDPISYPVSHRNPKKSLDKLDNGELELTPNKNTILHLVSQFGDIYYVEDILEKHPSLIYRRNCDGETPAYVAAREGHVDVLKIMINHFKKSNSVDLDSLLTRSIDNHTALHIAIQNHHAGVVFWLTKEIPQLANRINDHNESPLYHASERRYHAILKLLLRKCTNISFEGPNGKTALHAAAISGSPECIESLLSAKADLLYNQDKNGWTPLRYAIDHNNSSATAVLLDKDCSIGYDTMRKDGIITSPIHIAASQGHYQTMEVLISKCPGCLEITHSKGRNILHFAIENKKTKVIEFIFRDKSLTSLINKKDSDGNTPIHLLMASDLEMMEITMDSRVDVNILNHEGRTPLDMIPSEKKRKKFLQGIAVNASLQGSSRNKSPDLDEKQLEAIQEQEKMYERQVEKYFKMKDNLVLVVALIATATFAAGFTVPGGFDSNVGSKQEGMPILLGKPAFQAFVVFNAIAFACSCCVLFGHFRLQIYLDDEQNDMEKVENIRTQLVVMFLLTALAMITMAMAFAIGVYVVVTPFLGLAIYLSMISVFIMSFKSIFPVDFLNSIALLGTQIFRFI